MDKTQTTHPGGKGEGGRRRMREKDT